MNTKLLGSLFAAIALVSMRGSTAPAHYVAHEWGTFTSVQGSDGVPLAWNPFTTTDLPAFVFNRQKPTHAAGALAGNADRFQLLQQKFSQSWLQRMETPVIYFHAPEEITVDVRVRFPKGLLTEWFPQVTSLGPIFGVPGVLPNSDESHLRWDGIRVLPPAVSSDAGHAASLPSDGRPSHYYPARNTGANLVESTRPFVSETESQRDRLLFYRGAGNFSAPLRASVDPAGALHVANLGSEPLGALFAVRVNEQGLAFRPLGALAPGENREVQIPSPSVGDDASRALADLGTALETALVASGLFADESAAMVNTWRESWFTEKGLRVLYLLPSAWTERTLSLALNPAPEALVRVMVGRADILEPATERTVANLVARYVQGESDVAIAGLRKQGLGRFLEPAITRAGNQMVRENHPAVVALAAHPSGTTTAEASDTARAWDNQLGQLMTRLRALDAETSLQTASR